VLEIAGALGVRGDLALLVEVPEQSHGRCGEGGRGRAEDGDGGRARRKVRPARAAVEGCHGPGAGPG
jgi:hypothetical protein